MNFLNCVFMDRAFELAKKGLNTTMPNPRVGCVIVADGKIVGEGYHRRAGQDHAEVIAIKSAGEKARNSSMYITLEPCSFKGKT
ncbi:MAG: deaminase, partial [Burkholderiaceae bacterium]